MKNKKSIDSLYKFLTKNKIFVIFFILFSIIWGIKGCLAGDSSQSIVGNNNIQSRGDVVIYNQIDIGELCKDCFKTQENNTAVEVGILNHYEYVEGDFVNFYKMRITLPNGQQIYFDKFLYNETKTFGLCSKDRSSCYIFPQFRYNPKIEFCLDAEFTSWDFSSLHMKGSETNANCVQHTSNDKFFAEEVCK